MSRFAVTLSRLQPKPIMVNAEDRREAVIKASVLVFEEYPGFFIETCKAAEGTTQINLYWSIKDPEYPRIIG